MDTTLAHWLNELTVRHAALEDVATWGATQLALVLVATLIVGWVLAVAREIMVARQVSWALVELPARAGFALAAGLAANQAISHLWLRVRPYDATAAIQRLLPPSADPSFPSDHATAAFALALAVLTVIPWLGRLLIVEAAVLAVSRVAVGMHYPGDVVGGALVALIAAGAADQVVVRLRGFSTRLASRARSPLLPVAPPVAAAPSRALYAAGLGAALLGLPAIIEGLADPVRIDPAWVEGLVLAVSVAGLTMLWVVLVRGVGPAHARGRG